MSLHIREVTTENWRDIAALNVAETQQEYIESNAFSMAEVKFEGNGTSVGLYEDDTLVGYAMYGWYSKEKGTVWLDRFMIDEHFQGKGLAKNFIPLLVERLIQIFGCQTILLSVHPDNKPAQTLYESFGFQFNGDVDEAGPVFGLVMALDVATFLQNKSHTHEHLT